jgi:hypothetical protein
MSKNKTFWSAVEEILSIIAKELPDLPEPIQCILAGGAAVHHYVHDRVSHDVDIEFSKRLIWPEEIITTWETAEGKTEILSLDRNYTSTLGLMHPDYAENAIEIERFDNKLALKVLTPTDLAISKVARFQDHDQSDIAALARFGLLDEDEFKAKAEEAMRYYLFPKNFISRNIEKACRIIQENSPLRPSST